MTCVYNLDLAIYAGGNTTPVFEYRPGRDSPVSGHVMKASVVVPYSWWTAAWVFDSRTAPGVGEEILLSPVNVFEQGLSDALERRGMYLSSSRKGDASRLTLQPHGSSGTNQYRRVHVATHRIRLRTPSGGADSLSAGQPLCLEDIRNILHACSVLFPYQHPGY